MSDIEIREVRNVAKLCKSLNPDKIIEVCDALLLIRETVDKQAEDEALWSVPAEGMQPISEAYLQQELRRLHKVIEDGK